VKECVSDTTWNQICKLTGCAAVLQSVDAREMRTWMGVLPGAARFVFSAPKWQGGQNYTTAIPTESGTVGNGWRDRETLAFLSILKTKSHATIGVNQGTDFSCLTWGSPRGTVVILNGEQVLFSAETTAKSLKGSTASKAMRTMHRGIPAVRDRAVRSAAKVVLESIFEADLEPDAYGYQPKRSAHDAIQNVH